MLLNIIFAINKDIFTKFNKNKIYNFLQIVFFIILLDIIKSLNYFGVGKLCKDIILRLLQVR